MYHEVWRIERDFFYDPHYHGLDLAKAEKKYEPYLDGLALARRSELPVRGDARRADASATCSSAAATRPKPKKVKGGLLGADYAIENGRYRFARVYNGENWNPDLRAPLTQPGVNVKAGEYLLAVNGRELQRERRHLQLLRGARRASRCVLKVGPNAGRHGRARGHGRAGRQRREPAAPGLDRRQPPQGGRADRRQGRLRLPAGHGRRRATRNFNRYFFAQVGKEAAIIDERFNGGGQLADYIIDYLRAPADEQGRRRAKARTGRARRARSTGRR